MRLLTVTHFYEAHGGGIERVAGHLCRSFEAQGHQAVWAASAFDVPPDDTRILSVPLDCVDPLERVTGLPMPLPGWRASKQLSEEMEKSDGVIIHDALYATSIMALIAARKAGKPVVLIQHIAQIPFSNPILKALLAVLNFTVAQPILASADHVVFISDTTRRAFARVRFKSEPSLLFNGVNHEMFNPARAFDPNATRKKWALPTDKRLILFIGRFVEKKGLKIIKALAASKPEFHFALAGKGPIDPNGWRLPNVTVISGAEGRALADLYRAADLLLLPSVGEGYPLVVQEAMACGLPIVCGAETAAADPGAAAYLHGVYISLRDVSGSASRCSEAIDKLAKAPFDGNAMAAYARRAYDWDRTASAIVALFTRPPPAKADNFIENSFNGS